MPYDPKVIPIMRGLSEEAAPGIRRATSSGVGGWPLGLNSALQQGHMPTVLSSWTTPQAVVRYTCRGPATVVVMLQRPR
jgi:hypothetical protein